MSEIAQELNPAPVVEPVVRRRPGKLLFLSGIFCWLATIASVILCVWLWRSYQWPPDFRLGLGVCACILLLALSVAGSAIHRLLKGPDRFGAIVGLVVGLLPLLFWPVLFSDVYWRATSRGSLPSHWIVGPIAIVASNAADGEVAYRYPRRIAGEWVTLIDRGEPEGYEPLVQAMDSHIESMCKELQATLERPVYWVRGRLLGVNGKSFAGWAICEDQPVGKDLTYLDRHEVAHATIGLLVPSITEPPMLLAEGWAEYQSRDREQSRLALIEWLQSESSIPTLDDLIGEVWYKRSDGPVYIYGAPLVEYLFESYGGRKFLDLYSDVNQTTFRDRFEHVYGVNWDSAKSHFFQWLKEKHPQFVEPSSRPVVATPTNDLAMLRSQIELRQEVDKDQWNSLFELLMTHYEERSREKAMAISMESKSRSLAEPADPTKTRHLAFEVSRILLDEKQAWFSHQNRESSTAIAVSPSFSFYAERDGTRLDRKGRPLLTEPDRQQGRSKVIEELQQLQGHGDLITLLLRFIKQQKGPIVVQGFERMDDYFQCEIEMHDETRATVRIDTRKDYLIEEMDLVGPKGAESTRYLYEFSESTWIPTGSETTFVDLEGNSLVRTTNLQSMDQNQQRSFVDELRGIEIQAVNSEDVPSWLFAIRSLAWGWTGLAALLSISFGLLRL